MHPPLPPDISTFKPSDYIQQLTPEPAAFPALLRAEAEQFYIVPVEQLYPLFTRAMPPARSTVHTFLCLTSGVARMSIGNETHAVGPGEVLLARAGQVYSFQPGDVNTGFLCLFHNDMLLGSTRATDALGAFDFLHFWSRPVIPLQPAAAEAVEQLLRRLLAEYEANQLHFPALVRAYLLALLHELNRAYAADAPGPATAAAALTNQFKQLVAASLATTHRVADYADRLCVSANHLSKCVRRVTGKSPAKWIEESVVLEAKVLLFQSTWSAGEIALAVGLADASYFSRLFKKNTGLTPLEFRKRNSLS